MKQSRRQFLNSMAVSAGTIVLTEPGTPKPGLRSFPISCNQYSWITFYERAGKDWGKDLDASLEAFASSGIKAYEPAFNNPKEVWDLLPLLIRHGLEMPSVYVSSVLHRSGEAAKSISDVLAIAKVAKSAGTRIIATNPNPIQWGSGKNKSDEELTEQARNLDLLGAELKKQGMTLAYHMHDVEMRAAAREFHHMMLSTDPKHVSLCLDVHWAYRGSGNSQVALFDIVKLYGKRIIELHLRQSKDGIWQETFQEGDISYGRLAATLHALNVKPLLVLEQCLEKDSPITMNAVQAHQQDLAYCRSVFGSQYH
ncbi:TIM barrel protein [Dyadobacter pollutisoli]|uniref:TIM barrel protein n=2 Tax=Dyadobacter pollutisoli TaxID=2910158 RepID=A0A9E8NHM0_9BACT|nr:TIM barrel protein [Dyadobacter pollutisoli]WAC15448.1 TIM barrel protein [Dyadobacter pollutisoli]